MGAKVNLAGQKFGRLLVLAEEIGINGSTLYNRINVSGWPIERALAEPVKQHLTVRNYHG